MTHFIFLKKMILFLLIPVIHLIQPVATWILEKLGRNSTTKELIEEIDAQLKGKLPFRLKVYGEISDSTFCPIFESELLDYLEI